MIQVSNRWVKETVQDKLFHLARASQPPRPVVGLMEQQANDEGKQEQGLTTEVNYPKGGLGAVTREFPQLNSAERVPSFGSVYGFRCELLLAGLVFFCSFCSCVGFPGRSLRPPLPLQTR